MNFDGFPEAILSQLNYVAIKWFIFYNIEILPGNFNTKWIDKHIYKLLLACSADFV